MSTPVTGSLQLATLTESGDANFDAGTLVLAAGPHAGGLASDPNAGESFRVSQDASDVIVEYDLPTETGSTVTVSRTYSGVNEIYFDGGAGNDSITIDPSVTLPVTLIGGAGNDTLIGGNGPTIFVGGAGDDTITGGTAGDTYLFENGWGADKILDNGPLIGGQPATDRFDFSAVTDDLTVTLGSIKVEGSTGNSVTNPTGGLVEGIERMMAGGGDDTLVLNDAAGTQRVWTIDGAFGRGDIDDEFFFERFENLTGGAQNDVFAFAGGSISGTIDGGDGENTLNYSSAAGPIEVNRESSTASFIGGYTGIDGVVGSSSTEDTLIGANANSTWDITGANQGDIGGSFDFSSFENLTGGDSNDTFNVKANGSLSGKLRGTTTLNHSDGDELNFSDRSASIVVDVQGQKPRSHVRRCGNRF